MVSITKKVVLEGNYLLWVLEKSIDIGYGNVAHTVFKVDNRGTKALVANTESDSLFVIDLETEVKTILDGTAADYRGDSCRKSVLNRYEAVLVDIVDFRFQVVKDFALAETIHPGAPWNYPLGNNLAVSPNGRYIVIPLWNTIESINYLLVYEGRRTAVLGYSTKGSQSASINGILRASKFRSSLAFPISNIKVYVKELGGVNPKTIFALIYDSALGWVAQAFAEISAAFDGWKLVYFDSPIDIAADTDYWLGVWADSDVGDDCECYFGDGATNQMAVQAVDPISFPPDPLIPDSYANKKLSIYGL